MIVGNGAGFFAGLEETFLALDYDADVVNYAYRGNVVVRSLSDHIAAGGANTTVQLTAPSGKSTSDFDAGRIQDDENPADAVDITADDYTEMEWCLHGVAGVALESDVVQFRVVLADGAVIETYSVDPRWTIQLQRKFGSALQVKDPVPYHLL